MSTPSDSDRDFTRVMEEAPDPTAVQPLADRPDGGVPGLRRPQRQRPSGSGFMIAVVAVLVVLGIVFALSERGPSTDDGTDDVVESDDTDAGEGGTDPGESRPTTEATSDSANPDDSTTESTDADDTSTTSTTESTSTTADDSSSTAVPTTTGDAEPDATATTVNTDG